MTSNTTATETERLLRSEEGESNAAKGVNIQPQNHESSSLQRAIVFGMFLVAALLLYSLFVFWHDRRAHEYGKPDTDALRFETKEEDLKRKYRATQFISFTINTMGGLAKYGECKHRHVDNNLGTCYLGDYNITNDVHQRVLILKQVLHRLKQDRNGTRIDPDPSTLKVMMVPEFYMRGPHGAYAATQIIDKHNGSTTTPGLLMEAAAKIRQVIADDFFENWLFVFGTLTYAQVDDDQPEKPWWSYDDLNATEVIYLNFAPVLMGGTGHNHYYVMTKKYISVGDFLGRTTLPDPTLLHIKQYAHLHESSVLSKALEAHNTKLVEHNIITIHGIRIGVEICLDHLLGRLWKTIQEEENSQLVDMHLIVSGGLDIESGPNPVVQGGVVYNTDGEASSAACTRTDTKVFDPESVCRTPPSARKRVPIGGDGLSNFVVLQSCIDEEHEELLTGFYSQFQTQGCANTLNKYGINVMDKFKFYPPSIEIYPTIDLPRKSDYYT
ncbi:hypothetical protein MPSEU_000348300 [Mayamaea pseudoterrestris]|nr:hypothetical protein MPSEU_000348300 [Mayamaea pseudoterrestris]